MKAQTAEASLNRPGVVFSSGFFGFYAHAGFLSALRKMEIKPSAYGGSSSGAILAAMAASGMSDEKISEILFDLKKKDFWDPDPFSFVLKRALVFFKGYEGFLNGKGFADLLQKIPVRNIEECQTQLVIAATNLTKQKAKIFKSGNLVKAVQASGAVPVMFKPVRIENDLYADGGVVAKAPVMAVADLKNIDRIIIHMISSRGIENSSNWFLKKRFTPWHLHYLSYNIARMGSYRREVELARERGIEVIEIRTNPPPVRPNRLWLGAEAYSFARESTLRTLSCYEGKLVPE